MTYVLGNLHLAFAKISEAIVRLLVGWLSDCLASLIYLKFQDLTLRVEGVTYYIFSFERERLYLFLFLKTVLFLDSVSLSRFVP